MKNTPSLLWITAWSTLFFALDRVSKVWMEQLLQEQDLSVIGNWLRFDLHYNDQLALSLPFPLWGQITLSIVLLIGLIWYFSTEHKPQTTADRLAISMIFGGAIGNLFDRIVFGQVVDFIAVWQFPVFNIADTVLFLGICFLLFQEIRKEKCW